MKAIVLASGAGNRLRPLTDRLPKPLLEVAGRAIIDRLLDSLVAHGVDSAVITTGPFAGELERHLRHHHRIDLTFVHNPRYEVTNNIYSLWLAREHAAAEAVVLHSDLVCADSLLRRLLGAGGSRVPVNRTLPPPAKDFKALVQADRVRRIAVDVGGPGAFFCAPAYRLGAADLQVWLEAVEGFVRAGKTDVYAEDALNSVLDRVHLRPLYFEEFCLEVDTADDLHEAERLLGTHRTSPGGGGI